MAHSPFTDIYPEYVERQNDLKKKEEGAAKKCEMAVLRNCPLPWDSGSTHGSLA